MYCEKCCRIIDENRCPACGSRKVREPGPHDPCFLTEQGYLQAGMLKDVLEQNGIHYLVRDVMGAGMAIKVGPMLERSRFYVPYEELRSAEDLVGELFAVTGDGDEEFPDEED